MAVAQRNALDSKIHGNDFINNIPLLSKTKIYSTTLKTDESLLPFSHATRPHTA